MDYYTILNYFKILFMGRIYTSLGTMSGTSFDGIDLSIIETDGLYNKLKTHYKDAFIVV